MVRLATLLLLMIAAGVMGRAGAASTDSELNQQILID